MSEAGKGSKRRPAAVPREKVASSWERTFGGESGAGDRPRLEVKRIDASEITAGVPNMERLVKREKNRVHREWYGR